MTVPHTDIHSHLIPSIDDGVQSTNESIRVIKALKQLGYRRLITTPHVMSHRFPNNKQTIAQGLSRLRHAIEKENIAIDIEVSAEYYFDDHFLSLIINDDLIPIGGKYILFEFSYAKEAVNVESAVHRLIAQGYQPILAHPERYLYLHERSLSKYKKLKEYGLLFQININSLGGYYSKPVQKIATKLSESGMVDFIGSDTHGMRHVEALTKNIQSKAYKNLCANNTILNDYL